MIGMLLHNAMQMLLHKAMQLKKIKKVIRLRNELP